MRFLLVFLVILVLAWRWRTWREAANNEKSLNNNPGAKPTDMVACHQCGVHVPAGDAVAGALGTYCSVAHRTRMES